MTPAQKEWGGNAVGEGCGKKGGGSDMAGMQARWGSASGEISVPGGAQGWRRDSGEVG